MSENNEIKIENNDENYNNEYSDDLDAEQILDEILNYNSSRHKKRIININDELKEIKYKMENNNIKIEEIKLNLIKLKEQKKQNEKDIIDLLSKKESIEEVYKNQIFALKNRKGNNFINNLDKESKLFNMSLEEFKQINLDKYIEQVLSMCEDILDDEFDKDYLKNIINNSYKLFMDNISMTDVEFIIDNYISKISLYISNQSFGKYLEKDINIFLGYLININIINEKIEKLGKFVNKQYKDKKSELKDVIKNLESKNEILSKHFKYKEKILKDVKNEPNEELLFSQNFNFNINNSNPNNFNNKFENPNNIVDKQIYINYNPISIKEKNNDSFKDIKSEDDSFNKNLNYISDDEYADNNSQIKNVCNDKEQKLKNNLIDIKDNNNKITLNKHSRIKGLLEDLELNKNKKRKENNLGIKIYNKKNIKRNKINKYNESGNIKNANDDEKEKNDVRNMDEVINTVEKSKINIKNSNIKKNIRINDINRENDKINNLIINNSSIENSKNKDIINNKSHDFIFKKKEEDDNNLSKHIENQDNIMNNNIFYNDKQNKDNVNKIKTNNIEQSDIEIENNNKNSKDTKIKKNNKIQANKNILKKIIKSIKKESLKNKKSIENMDNKTNSKDNNNINGENNNFVEKIINKLLVQKNNNLNINSDNIFNYLNKKISKEKSKPKNLEKYITKNEIINNNINNNNQISLPNPNQPISNRISKLSLNIFITQNKENNDRLPELNILSGENIIMNRNKENQSNVFNKNDIKNYNVINGLKKENIINLAENCTNNKDKINLKKNNVFRKLNLDKKIYEERKRILIDREFFSSNNRNNKRIRKIKCTANKSNEITELNQDKRLKNQYSLFYNTHDFSINNNLCGVMNKSKKKEKKLLLKNFSNIKTVNNKMKIKDEPKYKGSSHSNKFNNDLLKKNRSNNSYSLNNNKCSMRNKIFIQLKNINNKENNNILTNTYNNDSISNLKNKNKRNQIIKIIKNQNETFNNTLNANIDTISNNSINNALNKIIFVNKKRNINNKKNKNTKNDLKKLLEKNLKKIIPNNSINFNPKKIFAEGVMESFCYFKILEKDSQKFNPLDSYAINPESLGYSEGYISIDVILGQFRIIPKSTISKSFKMTDNNSEVPNNSLSMSEYTLYNNGNNVFRFEIDKNEEKNCIRIDLKNINQVKIKQQMQDIIKIRKIFLKYNSHSNSDNEDTNGKAKKKPLSINKLLYMKEISEINMDQNEKIKAALCNFFSFTILFGNYKINKVECIFINFDLFNIWNKCLEMIAENNNKSKNSLDSHRGLLHKKNNSNIYLNTNN